MLHASLRRLDKLRRDGGDRSDVRIEIQIALDLWEDVTPPPPGTSLKWPSDVYPLALKLGLAAESGREDPELHAMFAQGSTLSQLVEIVEAPDDADPPDPKRRRES
jgi:hypothetical protein